MSVKQLFEMGVDTSSDKYGFVLDHRLPSVLSNNIIMDDLAVGFGIAGSCSTWDWEVKRLASVWIPPCVEGPEVDEKHDYYSVNLTENAISERAAKSLKPLLKKNCELLPIQSKTTLKYYIVRVTTVANVLDVQKSKCEFWCDPPTTTFWMEHFEFQQSKLAGLSIFAIPQYPGITIVTDQFVEEVQENNLKGFYFKKIWPFKKGTDWDGKDKESIKT